MAKPTLNPKKALERLRSNEPAGALASDLGVREAEVITARDLVRHIGEHQAAAAGRLPDPLAQTIVEAAVQIEHVDFLKALAEQGGKAAASAAKRALSILRTRGIEVELAPKGEPVFKQETKAEEMTCFVTTHDGAGERALWVPRPMHGGRLQLVTVVFSDARGIEQVSADEVSRKSFRRLREDLTGSTGARGITLLEIPLARAKGYIAQARSHTPRGLSIDAEAVLANLIGDPKDAEPPVSHEPPLAPETEAQRVAASASLHDEQEVRSWIPEADAVRALGLKLDEVATSKLYVDEAQRQQQSQREVERASEDYFTPERRRRYANRLFELAEALRATGRAPRAEIAAATARALLANREVSAIPFCPRLFQKLVAAPGARPPPEPKGAESSLLVP